MNIVLLQKVQQYMQEKKWSKTDLAKYSGIHISDISRIINHKQPLSLKHLDAITEALGLVEGTLYLYYVEECFNENQSLDKHRSIKFLYKCLEKGCVQPFNNLIDLMKEENTIRPEYLTYIFSVAEKLFVAGKEEKALSLYELIIENESNQFSEQLAISFYRKFYVERMTDNGHQTLTYVLEHLAYMPKGVRKEAYMWIMSFYYRSEQWEEVLYYSKRLERMAREGEYYGRALMYKSFALTQLGASMEEVLILIDQYAQVSEYFADVAVGNRYIALLDFGQLEYVDEYIIWLEDRDDLYVGLPRVFETLIQLHRLEDATHLLEKFRHVIIDMAVSKESWLKQKMYLNFLFAHALYQCKRELFPDGLNELLDVAIYANKIGNVKRLQRCLLEYWRHKHLASSEQEEKYMELLNTMTLPADQVKDLI